MVNPLPRRLIFPLTV